MSIGPSTADAVIPQPRPRPLIGNLLDVDRRAPVQSIMGLAQRYGPIFRMEAPGRDRLIISSRALVDEACDERRFDKKVGAALLKARLFTGDGLFTARTDEPNWRKAHAVLMPTFAPRAMQDYLPQMVDIAGQLVEKWARLNPDDVVDVAEDMTRLTLDTIGLCGFDYRFNSFYREDSHPFVHAMTSALGEALRQLNSLPGTDTLKFATRRRFRDDVAFMNGVVDQLIRRRRADPEAIATRRDLLNSMLTSIDKKTGERLDDLNIRYQIITFLIAGHETTSGLLSFALYFLVKHPDVLAKAYREVDRVLDGDPAAPPTLAQIQRLAYLTQVLKESLRLWPTAPVFTLYPREATTLGGRYPIRQGQDIAVLLPMLHRDPSVWGPDPERFDPDRFDPDRERQLPPNCFKPFGNGQRACIGQPFAMQEALLTLGMILRRFDLLDHADYRLKIKETLTLKPDGFTLKVRPRAGRPSGPGVASRAVEPTEVRGDAGAALAARGTPLLVLYGSNMGTAEGLARQIADDARAFGFATTLGSLDDHAEALPSDGAVVVVCSSYNGAPPDNAGRFLRWIDGNDDGQAPASWSGGRFAVFGCGDRNWRATYQAVPTRIDERLAAMGGSRVCPRGEADAAADFDGQFQAWYAPFWPRMAGAFGLAIAPGAPSKPRTAYRVEVVERRADPAVGSAFGARRMTVVDNRELQRAEGPEPSDRSTRHLELRVPEGVTYAAGDHLGVVPRNGPASVRRALDRFSMNEDAQIIIRRDQGGKSHLPLDRPVRVDELLAGFVELQDLATRDQVRALAEANPCPPEKTRLLAMAGGDEAGEARFRDEVLGGRLSVLDLLALFQATELPFGEFLAMLAPIRPRYYSISSSPMADPTILSITVAVVNAPARSTLGTYQGVTSTHLAGLSAGDEVSAFVRPPGTPFRPPGDPASPMIMVGAGTGLAPYRGFLQERAAIQASGTAVGPSLLFFGCRRPDHDFLYERELREFEARGVTRLVTAFSRDPGRPRCYVQHALLDHADEAWDLIERGATIFVCGDAARLAPDVQAAFRGLYQARTGADPEAAASWLDGLRSGQRYVEDVWASG